jgi:hypothetical protein
MRKLDATIATSAIREHCRNPDAQGDGPNSRNQPVATIVPMKSVAAVAT